MRDLAQMRPELFLIRSPRDPSVADMNRFAEARLAAANLEERKWAAHRADAVAALAQLGASEVEAVEALAAAMAVLQLLDFVRLALGIPLVIRSAPG